MNSKNGSNNLQLDSIKLLGKKVKRFKNIIKPINIKPKKLPKISKSTLIQIEKVLKNHQKSNEKIGTNSGDMNNFINQNEMPKLKLPELSLKEQYQDLLERKELILPPKYRLLLRNSKQFYKKN